jgi:transposase
MSHYKLNHVYVGVDLHKGTHAAVVMNCWNEKLGEIQFDNKPSAFPDFLKKVNKLTEKRLSPIFGLEDVGGYGRSLAIYLLEQKQQVREVNTALSSAERKSNPMVKKNDSWDAECVARVLLTKLDTLPIANPQDIYWTIAKE